MYVYVIRNSATGKIYIGQHKGSNLKKYLQQKLSHAFSKRTGASILFNSMRKHPKDVWSIEPLIEVETKAEVDKWERIYIALYDTRNPEIGYNICKGGEGFTGPHSSEARAKVTEALKQRWSQPGFKEHWNSIMVGHDVSDDTKKKIKTKRALQDEPTRIEACRKWAANHPEEMTTRMSHETHVLGGKAGSREAKQRAARISIESGSYIKAQHTRWHLNRGIKKPGCIFCN